MDPSYHPHPHSLQQAPLPSRRRHPKYASDSSSGLILPSTAAPGTKKRNWTPSYPVLPPGFNASNGTAGAFSIGSGASPHPPSASSFSFASGSSLHHDPTAAAAAAGGFGGGLPTAIVPPPSSFDQHDVAHFGGLGESTYASATATFNTATPGQALDSTARLHAQHAAAAAASASASAAGPSASSSSSLSRNQEDGERAEHTDGPAPKRRRGVAGAIIDTALNAAIGTLAAGLTAWSLYSSWGARAENAAREELMRDESVMVRRRREEEEQAAAQGHGQGQDGGRSPPVLPHDEPPPPYHDDLSLSTPTSPGNMSRSGSTRQTPVYISGHRRKSRPTYRSYRSMRTGSITQIGASTGNQYHSNSGYSTPNRPGLLSQRPSFSALPTGPVQEEPQPQPPAAAAAAADEAEVGDDDDAFLRVNTNLASLIAEGQAALNATVVMDEDEEDEDEHLPALMNPAMHSPLHSTTVSPLGSPGSTSGGGVGGGFGMSSPGRSSGSQSRRMLAQQQSAGLGSMQSLGRSAMQLQQVQQQQSPFGTAGSGGGLAPSPAFDFNFGRGGPSVGGGGGGGGGYAPANPAFQQSQQPGAWGSTGSDVVHQQQQQAPFVFGGSASGHAGFQQRGGGSTTTMMTPPRNHANRVSNLPRPSPSTTTSPYSRSSHASRVGAGGGLISGSTPRSRHPTAGSGSSIKSGGVGAGTPRAGVGRSADAYGSEGARSQRPRWG
ncbi:hypothetical protein OC845_004260 [Tilletia horrida]|nr:hypothetical protein OC845_004260 [Tilletia horrida]